MSRSILLDLARESIEEVLQAANSIDRNSMLERFPVLKEPIATFVTLRIDKKIRGSSGTLFAERPLIDDLLINAKAAAFEDPLFTPMTISEYLRASIEVSLLTIPTAVEYGHIHELASKLRPGIDGLFLASKVHQRIFLPNRWEKREDVEASLLRLEGEAGLTEEGRPPTVYLFQAETALDPPTE